MVSFMRETSANNVHYHSHLRESYFMTLLLRVSPH